MFWRVCYGYSQVLNIFARPSMLSRLLSILKLCNSQDFKRKFTFIKLFPLILRHLVDKQQRKKKTSRMKALFQDHSVKKWRKFLGQSYLDIWIIRYIFSVYLTSYKYNRLLIKSDFSSFLYHRKKVKWK